MGLLYLVWLYSLWGFLCQVKRSHPIRFVLPHSHDRLEIEIFHDLVVNSEFSDPSKPSRSCQDGGIELRNVHELLFEEVGVDSRRAGHLMLGREVGVFKNVDGDDASEIGKFGCFLYISAVGEESLNLVDGPFDPRRTC